MYGCESLEIELGPVNFLWKGQDVGARLMARTILMEPRWGMPKDTNEQLNVPLIG